MAQATRAVLTAANILDAAIYNNITVTILVGYGDLNNGDITGLTNVDCGESLDGVYVSYSTLRAALASHESSSLDVTFVNSLPNTSSINSVSDFCVPSAIAESLGLMSSSNGIDGAVGMGAQTSAGELASAALHELTHAMGRESGVSPFDLFRYTSPGNRLSPTRIRRRLRTSRSTADTPSLPTLDRHRIQAIS
jgi:serralysin